MSKIRSFDPMELPLPHRHGYLLSAVAPRPIAFASTIDAAGQVNLSPFSFFNVFSSNPPVMIFSPAKSGVFNSQKHSYSNVKAVPEVVINIVNYPMVEQMSLASTSYDKGVNEFVKAGFTEIASTKVKPPRVKESPVSFECTVDQVIELGEEGGAGNLVICRVVQMHIKEEYLDEEGKLDTKKLDMVGRMGGSWYCKANGEALFEIPKPVRTQGIGVDQLPEHIRNSSVLTGNNLGRLGNLEKLPDAVEIADYRKKDEIREILEHSTGKERTDALHKLAKSYLDDGDTETALKVLLQK